eukprot:3772895-Rhodomonas_salina.1
MSLATHACYTRPQLHRATPLHAQNLPVPSSTYPLTYGDRSTSPPHMASSIACSSLTTTPITCGCGSSSPKTMRARSWKPSSWNQAHACTLPLPIER